MGIIYMHAKKSRESPRQGQAHVALVANVVVIRTEPEMINNIECACGECA